MMQGQIFKQGVDCEAPRGKMHPPCCGGLRQHANLYISVLFLVSIECSEAGGQKHSRSSIF